MIEGEAGSCEIPAPFTPNGYEFVKRYNNKNINPVLNGFEADYEKTMQPFKIKPLSTIKEGEEVLVCSSEVRDVFKNGWRAGRVGDSIEFKLQGSEIALMYRKSINKPAPVAYAILDGDEERKIKLDANFEENWGDKAYMATIAHHIEDTEHSLKVVIEDASECESDFYLINVIGR